MQKQVGREPRSARGLSRDFTEVRAWPMSHLQGEPSGGGRNWPMNTSEEVGVAQTAQ